jgi:hypothetical protein
MLACSTICNELVVLNFVLILTQHSNVFKLIPPLDYTLYYMNRQVPIINKQVHHLKYY